MNPLDIQIEDYTYPLPLERIPKYPLEKRDQSKLLVYKNNKIEHQIFRDLKNYLNKETTLVFNDSKVLPVRLFFQNEQGYTIEIFCLEKVEIEMENPQKETWKCFVGKLSKWKEAELKMQDDTYHVQAELVSKQQDYCLVKFTWNQQIPSMLEVFNIFGKIPIPPYLNRSSEDIDRIRYQNVFAHHNGSVAAPTAGLHFTSDLLSDLKKNQVDIQFVTLHVGAGTFKPVKSKTLGEHAMHLERIVVTLPFLHSLLSKLKTSGSITAVGTTSLRTLESLFWLGNKIYQNPTLSEAEFHIFQWEPYNMVEKVTATTALQAIISRMEKNNTKLIHFSTEILIVPTYEFKIADCLITNFHQPNSTLLLLIAAVVGENWKTIYTEALDKNYRFLSYGDSSLLYIRNKKRTD